MKVGFIYIAQSHQIYHSLPVACALARDYPEIEVTLLARNMVQKEYLRRLASHYGADNIRYQMTPPPFRWAGTSPEYAAPKFPTLLWNLHRYARFDALVMPERTSLILRKLGLRRTKFIHTTHGAGDDERDWDTRIRKFDLVLLPGRKRRDRLLGKDLIRPGHYYISGYNKFDLVMRMAKARTPLFNNARKTVLYNPHHNKAKSSWPNLGFQVLDYFSRSPDYNLIFAPHIRMRDDGSISEEAMRPYRKHENILIDLGSARSVDMSYTLASDIYLGDWSSQIYEFLLNPRPVIFLNPRQCDWRGKEEYLWWTLGQVAENIPELEKALSLAAARQAEYEPLQKAAFDYTFESFAESAPRRAAAAIAAFLKNGRIEDDLA